MFTHLGIPKVCSHIGEVEFDSQRIDESMLVEEKPNILQNYGKKK